VKVFALNFLEKPSNDAAVEGEWAWIPENPDAKGIYGSGASTGTQQSTYVAEKDNRSDSDRPNEGMLIAA
jgi:hypothetical protein